MRDAGQGRLGRRLRRILLLLPYAIQHPGITVAELSRRFGVEERELIEDLNLVFLCGLPGYGPGDLIDVAIEEDRVYVSMADYFGAPLRLTPAEALALYAGGSAIAALPGMEGASALRRGLGKLLRALGTPASGDRPGLGVEVEPAPETHLQSLQEALRDRKKVRLEYLSATRGEITERLVDPWGLLEAMGRWYLVGWDHLRDDERMFRVDRIKTVTVGRETAEVPDEFDPQRYRGAFVEREGEAVIALEISPEVARWFEEYYPVRSSRELARGWRRVELATSGPRWAATLLLRLGDAVRRAEPEWVVAEARKLAAEIAARYGEPAPS